VSGALARHFARLVTNAVVRRPLLWRLFRAPLRKQFDQLAPRWDAMRGPGHLDPLEAALAALRLSPARVLDLGTGTGDAAAAAARRFPQADVVGVDLSAAMVETAQGKHPGLRFEQADASRLPFEDGTFDLVLLANAIPFFDELRRVVAPGGWVVFSFSFGPGTPIYVERGRLERELGQRGFKEFADFSAGRGTALAAKLQ
jgi:ubiquinone/menaquinone biosynthesis C-methylase UbiE